MDAQSIHQWVQRNIKITSSKRNVIQSIDELSEFHSVVIPLETRDQCLGVLVVCWQPQAKDEAHKCAEQLEQVTPNLAAAIDRIRTDYWGIGYR